MFHIYEMRANETVHFAAQELKKYLSMMMPEGGYSVVSLDNQSTDGFRLGLLEDFGLPCESPDPVKDDVIHIETNENSGILAGSNPRSVLFAVYRYLRENGCRWLYPGIDGDYIPTKFVEPVSYHHAYENRYRGFCDEGWTSQTCMLENIEYYAKLELNNFNLEFFVPTNYYGRYYAHTFNDMNRLPEDVSDETILQWRRQCEVELNKRGMIVSGIGHGWTLRALGFPPNPSKDSRYDVSAYTEEDKQVLAMLNGKRDFNQNSPAITQTCMSNEKVMELIVDDFVTFAENHPNIEIIAFSLNDGNHNCCECEACAKMTPTDWKLLYLNEIDRRLTEKNIPTRIGFGAYSDTLFPPEKVKLNNPDRYRMTYCPIARTYDVSITEDTVVPEPPKFVLNKWERPDTLQGYALLKQWKEYFHGDFICYDYHFWHHQFLDPGGYDITRRIYEDVRSLKIMGLNGMLEDGSQRSYFPNGFGVYIYAETLNHPDSDYDAVRADYFQHIYGKDWKKVDVILKQLSKAFDFSYTDAIPLADNDYYAPERVSRLESVYDITAHIRSLFAFHTKMPTRAQTVSWRLLDLLADYCDAMADIFIAKARGFDYKAKHLFKDFMANMGKRELEFERYYDHGMACRAFQRIVTTMTGTVND